MNDEKAYMRHTLFLEMQNYSLGMEDRRFHKEIVSKEKEKSFYLLLEDEKRLYMFAPLLEKSEKKETIMVMTPSGMVMMPYVRNRKKIQKVWYSKAAYNKSLDRMKLHLAWQFFLFVVGAFFVALLAAWYTLRPLRSSLHLLEDFIKDIIHDLNTPLSAILLNLKMIETQNEEIESIRISAQTIEMLHHNLDGYLREEQQEKTYFSLNEIVEKYVTFFTPLYDYLHWEVTLEEVRLYADKQAFERVIYNLLSNACKYNTNQGVIVIGFSEGCLTIENSSYGVEAPDRVFERFYKESERGLGIGLHIVEKLCQAMGVENRFSVEDKMVLVELGCKKIMD